MSRRPAIRFVAAEALRGEFERWRDRGPAQTKFELPDEPWDAAGIVCVARVDARAADAARRAALRGADLVVAVPDEPWAAPLVRDLARLGQVVVADRPADDPLVRLGDDQRDLLRRLADGQSIPEAAAATFLSVRTAERRLGAARRLLGVRTTAEAVLLAGGER